MRKIERMMVEALENRTYWSHANTMVTSDGSVYLHGNEIARRYENGTIKVNYYTLRRYPTRTTISRLRTLGCDITTKKGVLYYNNNPIDFR